jgi:hypothetical protein
MSDESTDLTPFEQRLAEVPPNPGGFQRDALLFAAGRAAGRRGRFWPAAAAALALLSAGLGATLALRPPSVVEVERVVVVPAPPPSVPEPAPPAQPERSSLAVAPLVPEWSEGMRLRERVARDGLGAAPPSVWLAPAPLPPPGQEAGGLGASVSDLSTLRLNATRLPGEQFP